MCVCMFTYISKVYVYHVTITVLQLRQGSSFYYGKAMCHQYHEDSLSIVIASIKYHSKIAIGLEIPAMLKQAVNQK